MAKRTPEWCPNCAYYGQEQRLVLAHRCVSDLACTQCGVARPAEVQRDTDGGLIGVIKKCVGCERAKREAQLEHESEAA